MNELLVYTELCGGKFVSDGADSVYIDELRSRFRDFSVNEHFRFIVFSRSQQFQKCVSSLL